MPAQRPIAVAGLALATFWCLPSCTETRVITTTKPILAGLPGTEGGGAFPAEGATRPDILQPVAEIRTTEPDGTVRLRSPTVRELMRHILQTIADDERDLFTDQILSKITKQEFYERGFDPATCFDEVKRRRSDLRRLFQAMPAGEFTPGILMQPVGRNVFRLRVEGDETMNWKYMDVVFESEDFKLRWFGR
jgi:hypothetical protein